MRSRVSRARVAFGGLALAVGAGMMALAQQAVFRSGVEMVVIDVNVVDGASKPVEGLKPEDFTVTVDRKPRNILSAFYVNHTIAGPGGGPSLVATGAARDVESPDVPAAALRNVLIVVDTDSMDVGDGMTMTKAARAFVDRLGATDRIGVATIPRLPSTLVFASDRALVRRTLDGVITGTANDPPMRHWIGLQEAFDVERKDPVSVKTVIDRECQCSYQPSAPSLSNDELAAAGQLRPGANRRASPASGFSTSGAEFSSSAATRRCDTSNEDDRICIQSVLDEAQQMALQAHMRAQRTLDALRQLADGLRQIDGPKVLVFLSGGLGIPETTTSFTPLEPAMAGGQVTLYTLYLERSQFGQVKGRLTPSAVADDRLNDFGVENLTAAAGGTLFRVIGQPEGQFARVAAELSGSYLLGIEVTAGDRDGAPHEVNVKVNRRGVEVRARRRYVIAPERIKNLRRADAPSVPLPPVSELEPPTPDARPVPNVPVMTPELAAVLGKAGAYVVGWQSQVKTLVSEEAYDETLSRLKMKEGGDAAAWGVEKQRTIRAEYVLTRAPGAAGWLPLRDVFEVDGRKVRDRDDRLLQLVDQGPAGYDKATRLSDESARYDIAFVDRNANLPTLALQFLDPANAGRFVFIKQGEEVVDGVPTWQVAFAERGSPTFIQGQSRDLPADGVFWIDPTQGRVVRSTLRLKVEPTDSEITVTYRPAEGLGDRWVPAEMRESHTASTIRLECVARFTKVRVKG